MEIATLDFPLWETQKMLSFMYIPPSQSPRNEQDLFKRVTFLLWIDKPNLLINKVYFLLFYAVFNSDRMNTFNFPWSHFRHFLQLMQFYEVKFTPWKSTGRNTVAYFQYNSKLIKYRWQYIIYNEQINYRLHFLSRFPDFFLSLWSKVFTANLCRR